MIFNLSLQALGVVNNIVVLKKLTKISSHRKQTNNKISLITEQYKAYYFFYFYFIFLQDVGII
jgi:hypothetical protein